MYDLLFVLVLLVLEGYDVFVTLFHLILAVVDFLLQLVVVLLERLHIARQRVLGVLKRLEMRFQVSDSRILVFQLTLLALILELQFSQRSLLRELGAIKAFVRLAELVDLVREPGVFGLHQVHFVLLLVKSLLQIADRRFGLTLLVLHLEDVALQSRDVLGLLLNLRLNFLIFGLGFFIILTALELGPGLKLLLLDKHLLFNCIDCLLLFDFHLVDDAAAVFSQLSEILHELLIRLLKFLNVDLIFFALLSELNVLGLSSLQLMCQILLDRVVVALVEAEPQVVACLESVLLDEFEAGIGGDADLQNGDELTLLSAHLKKLHELRGETLKIDHNLLFRLKDVVIGL